MKPALHGLVLRPMPSFILLAAVVAITATAAAQGDPGTRVDSLVAAEMSKRLIPGMAVVVTRNGNVLKQTGYGVANVERSTPATTGTLFQIASTTKNFTGVAIMQLVEAGRLRSTIESTGTSKGCPPPGGRSRSGSSSRTPRDFRTSSPTPRPAP